MEHTHTHEHTAEHFAPFHSNVDEIAINLDRYVFAMKYLKDKVVIDLGCGAGLGSWLYATVAKKVYAVDYDVHALEEARSMPFPPGRMEFLHLDITNKDDLARLPDADVVVALEVLEHIEDPAAVLKALRAPQLVFSVPRWSMDVSSWHRFAIETEKDVRDLIEPFYQIGDFEEQGYEGFGGKWIRGEGIRYRT